MLTAGGYKKKTIGITDKLINNFGRQLLNRAANWSAAKGGQLLPHFKHIVSREPTPPCPMAAVFYVFRVGWLLVGCWSSVIGQSTMKTAAL